MAILNQILANGGGFNSGFVPPRPMMHPNFMVPQAPASAGMNPQDPAKAMVDHARGVRMGANGPGGIGFDQLGDRAQDWLAQRGIAGDDWLAQLRGQFGNRGPRAPVMQPGGTNAPNPYGSGIMGSVMKAFNGGAAGGLDPAKLMAMAAGV